jgi:hypothetical protein
MCVTAMPILKKKEKKEHSIHTGVMWFTPVISALSKLRQEDYKLDDFFSKNTGTHPYYAKLCNN